MAFATSRNLASRRRCMHCPCERSTSNRTLLSGVMRTATTDEDARRWFRRYWTLGVGSGAHLLVNGVIDLTREIAER